MSTTRLPTSALTAQNLLSAPSPQKCRRRRRFPKEGRDGDKQAAYAVAAWLQRADLNGSLESFFNPPLTPEERKTAAVEGWILGVEALVRKHAAANRDFAAASRVGAAERRNQSGRWRRLREKCPRNRCGMGEIMAFWSR
jgi:hypothetical protein